jgi:hypothetical protein
MVGDDGSGTTHGLQVIRIEDRAGRALRMPLQTFVPISAASSVAGLALTPDGSHGAVLDGGNLVYFFTSKLATSTVNLIRATVNVTAFGGDGDAIASLPGGNDVVVSAGGKTQLALISGIASGKPLIAKSIPTSNRGVEYDGLLISLDGEVMLSRAGAGGLLDVYSVTSNTAVTSFNFSLVKTLTVAATASSADGREGMALSPIDSSRAVVIGANGTATLITGLPRNPAVHSAVTLPGFPSAVTISRDGKFAIVALSGGLVVLKGIDSGTMAVAGGVYSPTFSTPAGRCSLISPHTLGVMPDGKFVVTIEECQLQRSNGTVGTGVLLTIPFSKGSLGAPAGQLNYVVTPSDDQLLTH